MIFQHNSFGQEAEDALSNKKLGGIQAGYCKAVHQDMASGEELATLSFEKTAPYIKSPEVNELGTTF